MTGPVSPGLGRMAPARTERDQTPRVGEQSSGWRLPSTQLVVSPTTTAG